MVDYIRNIAEESDAETPMAWLRAGGSKISQAVFNNRLKKLVDARLAAKSSPGYNKHIYSATG